MPEKNLENSTSFETPGKIPEQSPSENKREKASEFASEKSVQTDQEKLVSPTTPIKLPTTTTDATTLTISEQNIILEKVENILANGMEQAFLTMDIATQAKFKAKGEETAKKIATLMLKTKLKAKQVVNLILEWLRIIPKINKFYIEQEAKIKADHIMKIYNGKK
ncbi:hypothetical protein C4566_01395 [Candidatus Parcubacteria bacterium]|nr:MAG: hypothetical protein C4566_01395 [Candidatus Parcubacteria bacterium]